MIRSVLQRLSLGPLWAILLLLIPAWIAVALAIHIASQIDLWFHTWIAPVVEFAKNLPQPLAELFAGDYGFFTMGPLLVVWATPVVMIHSLLMSLYKISGLLDHLATTMNPWLKRLGITGNELAHVVMGFGCNVPAIIGSNSSPTQCREACVSAITFGSACSYQLGATMAVFAVAGQSELVLAYLLYLAVTTVAYVRITAPPSSFYPLNVLTNQTMNFLVWPDPKAVWVGTRGVVLEFFRRALPIFFLITATVSLFQWLGALEAASAIIEPAMSLFRLPPEIAPAVIFASIRKDGILLLAEPSIVTSLSAIQLLTAVYLAGVLLPCLVTCLTIAREHSQRHALRLIGQQSIAAIGFSTMLAWGGAWI